MSLAKVTQIIFKNYSIKNVKLILNDVFISALPPVDAAPLHLHLPFSYSSYSCPWVSPLPLSPDEINTKWYFHKKNFSNTISVLLSTLNQTKVTYTDRHANHSLPMYHCI